MPQMTLKQMTQSRRPKFGTMVVEFDTPGMAKILKATGLDFAFIDMEHSGFDYGSLKRSLAYMDAANLPALVRAHRASTTTSPARWTSAPRALWCRWSARPSRRGISSIA